MNRHSTAIFLLAILFFPIHIAPTSIVETQTEEQIAFTSYRDDLVGVWIMDLDNPDRITKLTGTGHECAYPDYSPDGSKIIYANHTPSWNIWIMNADGTGKTQLTSDDSTDEVYPVWSPDGTKIVFTKSDTVGGPMQIWVMDANAPHDEYQLTNSYHNFQPHWSPDGTQIIFTSVRSPEVGDLYLRNADLTGSEIPLTPDTPATQEVDGQFSPDGSKILFICQDPQTYFSDVCIMDPDGSNKVVIPTFAEAINNDPAWSPDGTKIVFMSNQDGGPYDLYIVNADGSAPPEDLGNVNYDRTYPVWRPTVTPVTPEEATLALIKDVQSMNLQQGISNSLDSKLQNVVASLNALNADNRNDAINKLEAFISAVHAQSGNKLTIQQADYLMAAAQQIIEQLSA